MRITVAALALAVAALACFLPFAGTYLVVQQPLEHADAIVVLAGPRAERWLEGVDLFRAGWAPRIVLSRGRIDNGEARLSAIGDPLPPGR